VVGVPVVPPVLVWGPPVVVGVPPALVGEPPVVVGVPPAVVGGTAAVLLEGAVPRQAARSALPSVPGSVAQA
jgi:hypothetical protein